MRKTQYKDKVTESTKLPSVINRTVVSPERIQVYSPMKQSEEMKQNMLTARKSAKNSVERAKKMNETAVIDKMLGNDIQVFIGERELFKEPKFKLQLDEISKPSKYLPRSLASSPIRNAQNQRGKFPKLNIDTIHLFPNYNPGTVKSKFQNSSQLSSQNPFDFSENNTFNQVIANPKIHMTASGWQTLKFKGKDNSKKNSQLSKAQFKLLSIRDTTTFSD